MAQKFLLVAVAMASVALAAGEATGTVSASKGLQLNGQTVPVAGTKEWPVTTGDVLQSDAMPVILKMKDGSKVVLGKSSQVKLEAKTVRLLTGTMQYTLAQASTLQVAVKGDVLTPRSGVASTVRNPVAPDAAAVTTVATPEGTSAGGRPGPVRPPAKKK
jgi:hypothetical protein